MLNYTKVLFLIPLFLCFAVFSKAQNTHNGTCGHLKATQALYKAHPQTKPENNPAHQKLEQTTKDYPHKSSVQLPVLTIPTVVHVVHDNGPENLTDAEIIDAIVQLNEDFRAINGEIPNEIHPDFLALVADIEVEFELACLDPNGNPTNGITRTVSDYTYAGDDVQMKTDIGWPRNQYMNIWLVNQAFANSNSSGFAYYPPSIVPPYEVYDGIVISYWAFGRHSQTSAGYEHVLTHEVGHWANLIHTWSDERPNGNPSACNFDDQVADTPNTFGHFFTTNCNLNTSSCGTLDNNNNYMDYTGSCQGMFTLGQKDRMRAAIESSVANRSNLWSAANLAVTVCTEVCSGVDLDIRFDGFPAQTSWNITDANGNMVASSSSYSGTPGNSLLTENACLPDGCYTLNFMDALNNGMCPFRATATSAGTFITPGTLITPGSVVATLGTVVTPGLCGNYTLYDANGAVLASGGGGFGASETNTFCLSGGMIQPFISESEIQLKATNLQQMRIIPNIVNDQTTLYYSLETNKDIHIQIVDITGKIAQQYTRNFDDINEIQLDVNHLRSGFYFVQLISGNVMLTEKFVKR